MVNFDALEAFFADSIEFHHVAREKFLFVLSLRFIFHSPNAAFSGKPFAPRVVCPSATPCYMAFAFG